jgi:hypothetical protein
MGSLIPEQKAIHVDFVDILVSLLEKQIKENGTCVMFLD